MLLSNNTILITGGSSGIGLELARQLSANNTVIIACRDANKLKKAKELISSIHTYQCDISDAESVSILVMNIIMDFPRLNILINNAGIMRTIDLTNPQSCDISQEINTNLIGSINVTMKLLQHLLGTPNSAIINVSSGLAFVPSPMSPIYCASKAGLHSFTLSLRMQLRNSSVKVFEIAPPVTQTDMLLDCNPDSIKNVEIMSVEDMVSESIRGIKNDVFEICPGKSSLLRFMSRLAPNFALKILSKSLLKNR